MRQEEGHQDKAGGEEQDKQAAGAPGRETLTETMGGSNPDPSAWSGQPAGKQATRIDATMGGGGADPFDFSGYSGLGLSMDDAAGGMGSVGNGTAMGGTASSSSTVNTMAATWRPHGLFGWFIGWKTDGTSGWIVQRVTNTYSGTKKDGSAITPASAHVTPVYYEAWAVDSKGVVSPSDGATHDQWIRPSMGDGSKGKWVMRGDVYWTNQDPATSGLTKGGVRAAGILLSGTTAPKGLGSSLQTRFAGGVWDSTGATPTHTGTAG